MAKKRINILAKTPLILRVVSLYVLSGVFVWSFLLPSQAEPVRPVYAMAETTSSETIETVKQAITGKPRLVELPRTGLIREVIDGEYDATSQGWTLSDDKAQYAVMTPELSDGGGQALIYGHNTAAVFEPLKMIEAQDKLIVTSDTGRKFIYTYSHDRIVEPTDVSVLTERPSRPRVVLMTCEGWLSDTRRLLYFDFEDVL